MAAKSKRTKYFVFFIALAVLVSFLPIKFVQAEDFVYIRQIDYPLSGNYVLTSPVGGITLSVAAESIDQNAIFKLMQLADQKSISNYFTYSEDIQPTSDLYYFQFVNKENEKKTAYSIRPKITVKYQPDNKYKNVYYYNWADLKFQKMAAVRDTINDTLTFEVPEKESIIFALFDESQIIGRASWYVHQKYGSQFIAASRDFAQDAKLKVTNPANGKEVVVTVKDYGPKECSQWTEKEQQTMGPCQDRILDLSKSAFSVLSPTGAGVINILVRPVE